VCVSANVPGSATKMIGGPRSAQAWSGIALMRECAPVREARSGPLRHLALAHGVHNSAFLPLLACPAYARGPCCAVLTLDILTPAIPTAPRFRRHAVGRPDRERCAPVGTLTAACRVLTRTVQTTGSASGTTPARRMGGRLASTPPSRRCCSCTRRSSTRRGCTSRPRTPASAAAATSLRTTPAPPARPSTSPPASTTSGPTPPTSRSSSRCAPERCPRRLGAHKHCPRQRLRLPAVHIFAAEAAASHTALAFAALYVRAPPCSSPAHDPSASRRWCIA
jgi:hypothetical protein